MPYPRYRSPYYYGYPYYPYNYPYYYPYYNTPVVVKTAKVPQKANNQNNNRYDANSNIMFTMMPICMSFILLIMFMYIILKK